MFKRRSTYFWEDFGLDKFSRLPDASSGVPISPRNIRDESKSAQRVQWSEKMVVWKGRCPAFLREGSRPEEMNI
eukprot:3612987-Ditylum_brightwellii.AAC.1